MASKKAEISKLSKFIDEHSALYYSGNPLISDAEFDEAWTKLKELDPTNPSLDAIGEATFEGFEKLEHKMFMHSQQKARNLEEFEKWLNKLPPKFKSFRVDHKLDGLSIELLYEKGVLKHALTQGEEDGFDIVGHAKKMAGVPLTQVLDPQGKPFTGSLRGEMIMSPKIFAEKYEPKGYKNTRAAAIGLAKKPGMHLKDIQIVLYDSNVQVETHSEIIDFLREIDGASVVESDVWSRGSLLAKVTNWYQELTTQRDLGTSEGGLELEIDGLVVKCNPILLEDAKRKKPNYQIAIKFPAQEKSTRVKDIVWQQKGSTLTPLALLEPVVLCSTTVKKATLHNPAIIEEMDVRVGSIVRVSKRGDIIPKIEKVVDIGEGPATRLPPRCPSCDTKNRITKNHSRLYCPNRRCPAIIVHRIKKWINVLDVKHFGPELISAFVRETSPTYIYEIYDLTEKQMANWELSGKKVGLPTAKKVLKNLREASTELPLNKFLGALDIRTIDAKVFKFLTNAGYDLVSLCEATEDELTQVKNIGSVRAKLIVDGLADLKEEIDGMLDQRVSLEEIDGGAEVVPIKGSVCFTGALKIKRDQATSLVVKAGYEVKTGVSKGLTYLVTPDPLSGSAKNKKAISLGTKVIDEAEFMKLVS